jgi:hypothetical protein
MGKKENNMWSILDRIPYALLIFFAVFMLLAPFKPMPHLYEKWIMLKEGTLTRPLDIFDLFYHLVPTIFLLLKVYKDRWH